MYSLSFSSWAVCIINQYVFYSMCLILVSNYALYFIFLISLIKKKKPVERFTSLLNTFSPNPTDLSNFQRENGLHVWYFLQSSPTSSLCLGYFFHPVPAILLCARKLKIKASVPSVQFNLVQVIIHTTNILQRF